MKNYKNFKIKAANSIYAVLTASQLVSFQLEACSNQSFEEEISVKGGEIIKVKSIIGKVEPLSLDFPDPNSFFPQKPTYKPKQPEPMDKIEASQNNLENDLPFKNHLNRIGKSAAKKSIASMVEKKDFDKVFQSIFKGKKLKEAKHLRARSFGLRAYEEAIKKAALHTLKDQEKVEKILEFLKPKCKQKASKKGNGKIIFKEEKSNISTLKGTKENDENEIRRIYEQTLMQRAVNDHLLENPTLVNKVKSQVKGVIQSEVKNVAKSQGKNILKKGIKFFSKL